MGGDRAPGKTFLAVDGAGRTLGAGAGVGFFFAVTAGVAAGASAGLSALGFGGTGWGGGGTTGGATDAATLCAGSTALAAAADDSFECESGADRTFHARPPTAAKVTSVANAITGTFDVRTGTTTASLLVSAQPPAVFTAKLALTPAAGAAAGGALREGSSATVFITGAIACGGTEAPRVREMRST